MFVLGKLEIAEENVEKIMSAANMLQLPAVVDAGCSFLVKQLHPSNCLGIRSFADLQHCQSLYKAAHDYTMVGESICCVPESYAKFSFANLEACFL